MAIGGFIGDTFGGALNEYAPGIAQGVGDIFGGMSKAWDTLKSKLSAVWDSLQPLRDAFASIAAQLGFEEGGMSGVLQMVGEFIGNFIITPFMLVADALAFVGNLIGGFIVILVGTSLMPTVAQQVGSAQNDGNVTGAADTLLGLTTLFYALAIATSAIGIATLGLRNSGLI
jgi:hypothetical protein